MMTRIVRERIAKWFLSVDNRVWPITADRRSIPKWRRFVADAAFRTYCWIDPDYEF